MNLDTGHVLNITPAQLRGKRLAVIGKSGSGKTHLMFVALEEWLRAGLPAIVIDPMGQFHRMAQAFPMIVAGIRKTAHLNLTAEAARAFAHVVHEERLSVVLDMSGYRGGGDMLILEAFLQGLLDKVAPFDVDNPEDIAMLPPFMVMIDEAHLYAPQLGSTPVSESIFDLAKLGRHKNFTTAVATQRSAAINKEFLSQANLLVALRLSFGVDTKVLAEQLPLPAKDLNAMMRKLRVGEAVVIGDSDLIGFDEDYLRVQIRQREGLEATRDVSATAMDISGLSPISPELIARLQALLTPTTSAPARSGKAAEDVKIDATILEQSRIIDGLNEEVQRLMKLSDERELERDAAWRQVKELQDQLRQKRSAPVQMAFVEANAKEEEQVTVRERTTTTKTVEREIIGTHVSTRQAKALQTRQTRALDHLVSEIRGMSPRQRNLLVYYWGSPTQAHIEVAARAMDYETSNLQQDARRLFKLGMLQQVSTFVWKFDLARYVEQQFPNLDADGAIKRIWSVLA